MNHQELVLRAISYRRHTGASLGDIRAFAQCREHRKHTQKDDREVLRRLESDGTVVKVGRKWFFTRAAYKQAKRPALEPEWQPEDSWILLAALYNRDNHAIPLSMIVAMADSINHTIPTLEETHGALNRLVAARLLRANRDTFSVTDKAVALFAKVEAVCRKTMLDQRDGLRCILDCPCCGVKLKTVAWPIAMSSARLKDAVDAYRRMLT